MNNAQMVTVHIHMVSVIHSTAHTHTRTHTHLHREVEGAPSAHVTLRPHATSHNGGKTRADRQPQACTTSGRLALREGSEQPLQHVWCDPIAGIAAAEAQLVQGARCAGS